MTEEEPGVPDSDPRHLDPAGDIADLVESGEFDISLAEDQDREELEEFVELVRRDTVEDPDATEDGDGGLLDRLPWVG